MIVNAESQEQVYFTNEYEVKIAMSANEYIMFQRRDLHDLYAETYVFVI